MTCVAPIIFIALLEVVLFTEAIMVHTRSGAKAVERRDRAIRKQFIVAVPLGWEHVLAPSRVADRVRAQVPALAAHHDLVAGSGIPYRYLGGAMRGEAVAQPSVASEAAQVIKKTADTKRHNWQSVAAGGSSHAQDWPSLEEAAASTTHCKAGKAREMWADIAADYTDMDDDLFDAPRGWRYQCGFSFCASVFGFVGAVRAR